MTTIRQISPGVDDDRRAAACWQEAVALGARCVDWPHYPDRP